MKDKYVDGYLSHIRGLSHGSIANAITAAIDVLKVLQSQSEDPFAECNEISRLKNRRNKEQTLAERERQAAVHDDGTTILWEQVCNQNKHAVGSLPETKDEINSNLSLPVLPIVDYL